MTKVSCILTSYNQPIWLKQAITSVLTQTYQDFELYVLDDNSSDPEVKAVLDEFKFHPKVNVWVSDVRPENRMSVCRYAHLINEVLPYVNGEYVTYLTDDDYYFPKRFEVMVEKLQEPGVSVVYGWQTLQYGDDVPHRYRVCKEVLVDAYDIVDHNSVMHTKQAGIDVGGWDENPIYWRGADGIFWRRLTAAGYKFYPVNQYTEAHRFHTESVRHKLLEQGLTDLN